ncbi:homocysteine S-methyltransferase family protein [Pseudoponticoccus marisrubri]|uniref:Homocysteine methyltransferase n=1 Tax=Pseudoponticoccus marisrubri TaxID=1685382 RepID=A0A0W7WQ63_9RHOB|nr:homocysteine S-methyltransferase family protein [Pseudoponticoccus marisrubri]KUF12717.1 homocysteine methyltransferase [Pseudoponticoccus marisrubri]
MTDITLLDGGMGQELIRRNGQPATPLWSTQMLIDRPELVSEVHLAFADAGASVATTNSYALHRDRLRGGSSNHYASDDVVLPDMEDQLGALLGAALDAAEPVRDRGRIAGAIGPLGASYRADLHPDEAAAVPLYAEVAQVLAPRVDLLLFETIPSVMAARACLSAGRQTGRPVWLSFTVDDTEGDRLRSGERLAEVVEVAAAADAALVNCSAPEAMPAALDALAPAGVPMGAYANAFATLTKDFIAGGATAASLSARRDMGPEAYADHVMGWVAQGATIVGGCCETGPAHIAEIARRLRAAGHAIV